MNQETEDQGTLKKQFIAASIKYGEVAEGDLTMKAYYRGQKELIINLMLMEKAGTWTSSAVASPAPEL